MVYVQRVIDCLYTPNHLLATSHNHLMVE